MSPREQTEEFEKRYLSSYATPSCASAGRANHEDADFVRTAFQRDRDRILHSKAFRRLMHKTQVFISPTDDHYRTRLTHTLEVSQIARTISRALRLNEDLTESIALGHDVGHTPFGHTGEEALNASLKKYGKTFKHYEQSVRVLSVLENLNLTSETLDGIGGHSKGRDDLTSSEGELSPSLEAAVVRIADRIAYLNHDLDDALRAEWLSLEQLPQSIKELGDTHSSRINAMVTDIIKVSADRPAVEFSKPMLSKVNAMKDYLFEHLYFEYPRRYPDVDKARKLVAELFEHYVAEKSKLPEGFVGVEGAVDYISGMTDRFAIRTYTKLRLPAVWL